MNLLWSMKKEEISAVTSRRVDDYSFRRRPSRQSSYARLSTVTPTKYTAKLPSKRKWSMDFRFILSQIATD